MSSIRAGGGRRPRKFMRTKRRFRVADGAEEFEAIHRLDDRTFVEEIPQRPANPERRIGEVRLLAIDAGHGLSRVLSGCRGLFIGLEALSQDHPARWNKKTTRAAVLARVLPARDGVPAAGTDRESGDPAQPFVPHAAHGRRYDALTRPAASRR
jgi:hypothetical protein